jgi:hypothetical protein
MLKRLQPERGAGRKRGSAAPPKQRKKEITEWETRAKD